MGWMNSIREWVTNSAPIFPYENQGALTPISDTTVFQATAPMNAEFSEKWCLFRFNVTESEEIDYYRYVRPWNKDWVDLTKLSPLASDDPAYADALRRAERYSGSRRQSGWRPYLGVGWNSRSGFRVFGGIFRVW